MDKLLERESKAQAVIKQLPQYRYEFETIEMAYMFYHDKDHVAFGFSCSSIDEFSVDELCNAINAKHDEVVDISPAQKHKNRMANYREIKRLMPSIGFEMFEAEETILVLDNLNHKGIQIGFDFLDIPPLGAVEEIQIALSDYKP